jgi:hypothetical protein
VTGRVGIIQHADEFINLDCSIFFVKSGKKHIAHAHHFAQADNYLLQEDRTVHIHLLHSSMQRLRSRPRCHLIPVCTVSQGRFSFMTTFFCTAKPAADT